MSLSGINKNETNIFFDLYYEIFYISANNNIKIEDFFKKKYRSITNICR